MSKELKKAFLSVNNSYHYFISNCGGLEKEIVKYLDLPKDLDKYVNQLKIYYSPSDGVILIDEFANNFSVNMMMVLIGEKGKLSYEDLRSCSI